MLTVHGDQGWAVSVYCTCIYFAPKIILIAYLDKTSVKSNDDIKINTLQGEKMIHLKLLTGEPSLQVNPSEGLP